METTGVRMHSGWWVNAHSHGYGLKHKGLQVPSPLYSHDAGLADSHTIQQPTQTLALFSFL